MATFKLQVSETGNKAAKYLYQVIDEEGNIVSERRSNREYVACTADGEFYFGRLDLIGKGDHGKGIKYSMQRINNPTEEYMFYARNCRSTGVDPINIDEFGRRNREGAEAWYKRLTEIAYK